MCLSLLTNSALVIRVQMRGEGVSCGVSSNEYSCAHHVTWSPNKLWRSSTSIFNLCSECWHLLPVLLVIFFMASTPKFRRCPGVRRRRHGAGRGHGTGPQAGSQLFFSSPAQPGHESCHYLLSLYTIHTVHMYLQYNKGSLKFRGLSYF